MAKIKQFITWLFKDIKIINIVFALIGGIILAFVIRNIHSISPVTEGGMLGLVLLIDHWTNISPSITTPILNVLCYLFAFKTLGKNFIFYSVFAIIGFAGFLPVFELFEPLWPWMSENLLLASICGGIGVGISCGICVLASSAPTADDALALSLSKVTHLNITIIYMCSDLIVLLASLSYIPWSQIAYSLLTVIISGQIIGLMQFIKKKIIIKYKERQLQKENKID